MRRLTTALAIAATVLLSAPAIAAPAACKVNVNTATAAQLSHLPGLGKRMSPRVVKDRTKAGKFATVDALTRVRGIGPAKVQAMRVFVTLTGQTTCTKKQHAVD